MGWWNKPAPAVEAADDMRDLLNWFAATPGRRLQMFGPRKPGDTFSIYTGDTASDHEGTDRAETLPAVAALALARVLRWAPNKEAQHGG